MIKRLLLLLSLLFSSPLFAMQVDLQLTDIEGKQFKLSDYRGKWVVLNYWATWCPPCLEEIPELVYFHENHRESDGVVIGVDMEMLSPEVLRQFVDDNFMTYPIVPLVEEMQAFDDVQNFPTTYLIDPDGVVVVRHVGSVTSEALEEFINSYVPDKSASR
jgi:thiol-disulfide isomerase/thioredoxin